MATPSGGRAPTALPWTRSLPLLRSVRLAMQRRNVVLPQPEGPTTHMISLRLTASDSWWKATTAPSRKSLLAPSATMAGSTIASPATMRSSFMAAFRITRRPRHQVSGKNLPSAMRGSARPRPRVRAVSAVLWLGGDLLEHRAPLLLLIANEGGDFGRGHRKRIAAAAGKLRAERRVAHHLAQILAYLAHDRFGRAGRRHQPLPADRLEAGQRFGNRRQIGEVGQPPRRGDRERLEISPLDGAREARIALDDQRYAAAHDVVERVARTAGIRNQQQFDAGSQLQQFAGQMGEPSDAGDRIGDFAGSLFCQRNQFRQGRNAE